MRKVIKWITPEERDIKTKKIDNLEEYYITSLVNELTRKEG